MISIDDFSKVEMTIGKVLSVVPVEGSEKLLKLVVDFGEKNISSDDFKKIEDKILELARTKSQYIRKEVSKSEALAYFKEKGDEYKLELIE